MHTFDNLIADSKDRNKGVLRALKVLCFIVPVSVFGLLELGRLFILNGQVPRLLETIIIMNFLALGALLFSHRIFKYIDGVHREVSRSNRQLATLYKTGVAINSTLGLRDTIQLIIDEARVQLGATAGELVLKKPVLELQGDGHAVYFSGFDPSHCQVRSRSRLAGLNGLVLKTREPLRMDARQKHPASMELPPGHIQFESILSVPLTNVSGECFGAITLVKKTGEEPFTAGDEALMVNYANQAAIAIVNASLYEQVRHMSLLEERERIAREMHDGLGQIFAYLNIEMKIIDDLLASGKTEEAAEKLESLRLTAEDTSVDIRETIVNLRTSLLPGEDLQSALEDYIKDYGERNEIEASLSFNGGTPPQFTRAAQIQLICIVQEALANVRKHARARHVKVEMFCDQGAREVWVIDDGAGFIYDEVPAHGRHLGLTVMAERARETGGELRIESEPGKGTRIGVVLPASDEPVQPAPLT